MYWRNRPPSALASHQASARSSIISTIDAFDKVSTTAFEFDNDIGESLVYRRVEELHEGSSTIDSLRWQSLSITDSKVPRASVHDIDLDPAMQSRPQGEERVTLPPNTLDEHCDPVVEMIGPTQEAPSSGHIKLASDCSISTEINQEGEDSTLPEDRPLETSYIPGNTPYTAPPNPTNPKLLKNYTILVIGAGHGQYGQSSLVIQVCIAFKKPFEDNWLMIISLSRTISLTNMIPQLWTATGNNAWLMVRQF
jgi:hypothetical protein